MNGAKAFTTEQVVSLLINDIHVGAIDIVRNKAMSYAGIGWRQTPMNICDLMTKIATRLAYRGCVLRSGRALRADQAFEAGAAMSNNDRLKQIFLPYRGYNGSTSELCPPTPAAFRFAETYHPRWQSFTQQGRALHARNSHIILGKELNDHVAFVICYTQTGVASGGTGQAMRMADTFGIPIFNLQHYALADQFEAACHAPIDEAVGIRSIHGRHRIWI